MRVGASQALPRRPALSDLVFYASLTENRRIASQSTSEPENPSAYAARQGTCPDAGCPADSSSSGTGERPSRNRLGCPAQHADALGPRSSCRPNALRRGQPETLLQMAVHVTFHPLARFRPFTAMTFGWFRQRTQSTSSAGDRGTRPKRTRGSLQERTPLLPTAIRRSRRHRCRTRPRFLRSSHQSPAAQRNRAGRQALPDYADRTSAAELRQACPRPRC